MSNDSGQLQQLNALFSTSDTAPTDWQDYLQNGIERLNADLGRFSDKDDPLKGLPAKLEGEALIAFWKGVWSDFAEALNAWPEIRAAATEIVGAQPTAE